MVNKVFSDGCLIPGCFLPLHTTLPYLTLAISATRTSKSRNDGSLQLSSTLPGLPDLTCLLFALPSIVRRKEQAWGYLNLKLLPRPYLTTGIAPTSFSLHL